MHHLYFVFVSFLVARGITELSFQMGTDHLLCEFDRPLYINAIYIAFMLHLYDIYVSFMLHSCFIHVSFMPLKLICPFYRASPRWGLITSFRHLCSFMPVKLKQVGTDHQLHKFARKSRYLAKDAPWQRSNLKNGQILQLPDFHCEAGFIR